MISGFFLLGFCLTTISFTIALYLDPPSGPYGMLFTPFAIFLAWVAQKQFWTLFCCEPQETRALYGCFCSFGVYWLFPSCLISISRFLFDESLGDHLLFFVILFLVSVFALVVGFVNYADYQKRKRRFNESSNFQPNEINAMVQSKPYRKRYFIGIASMLAISIGSALLIASSFPPISEVNLSYEKFPYQKRLKYPQEGTNFSYCRGIRGTIDCQFTISEQGFHDWVAHWEPEQPTPISEKQTREVPWINPQTQKTEGRKTTDGFYLSISDEHIVFDRSSNTVYYWTSF